MSTRTALRPTTVISASMGANITGTPTLLQSLSMVTYSVSWTGSTPVGDFSVEASDDCTLSATGEITGGTWNPLPLDLSGTTVTAIPISGNTGKGMVDVRVIAAYAVRPVYTRDSGTGTLTVVVNGKVT